MSKNETNFGLINSFEKSKTRSTNSARRVVVVSDRNPRVFEPNGVAPNHRDEVLVKNHPSGWTIRGHFCANRKAWVKDFEAFHPKLGKVSGDFERTVTASSGKALEDFCKLHAQNE